MPIPVLVLGIAPDESHEAIRALLSAQVNQSDYRVVAYDLGLPPGKAKVCLFVCLFVSGNSRRSV